MLITAILLLVYSAKTALKGTFVAVGQSGYSLLLWRAAPDPLSAHSLRHRVR